jgi:hypothetical protein
MGKACVPIVRRSASWMAFAGLVLGASGVEAAEQRAWLTLTQVSSVCTPAKPDVTISRQIHSGGLRWDVDNQCEADVDVEVYGFEAGTTGDCTAPNGSKPFKEASREQKGVKKKAKKSFDRKFALGPDNGCWTYKVRIGANVFDPQIRIDR